MDKEDIINIIDDNDDIKNSIEKTVPLKRCSSILPASNQFKKFILTLFRKSNYIKLEKNIDSCKFKYGKYLNANKSIIYKLDIELDITHGAWLRDELRNEDTGYDDEGHTLPYRLKEDDIIEDFLYDFDIDNLCIECKQADNIYPLSAPNPSNTDYILLDVETDFPEYIDYVCWTTDDDWELDVDKTIIVFSFYFTNLWDYLKNEKISSETRQLINNKYFSDPFTDETEKEKYPDGKFIEHFLENN